MTKELIVFTLFNLRTLRMEKSFPANLYTQLQILVSSGFLDMSLKGLVEIYSKIGFYCEKKRKKRKGYPFVCCIKIPVSSHRNYRIN